MAYDPDLYRFDPQQNDYQASLDSGALLYRITSGTWCDKSEILSGNGAAVGPGEGRFHRVHQRATYCANNVMVCLAEMLYRLYREMLDAIGDDLPAVDLRPRTKRDHVLVVFAVNKIDDLVYADSADAQARYRSRKGHFLLGPSITSPDQVYGPLHRFSDEVRKDKKNGVMYPSTRHSEGFAYVLFKDETGSLKRTPYERLEVGLRLIPESQDFSVRPPAPFDIRNDKLHPTMGYYEFKDPDAFARLKTHRLIHPYTLPDRCYIDFVRRYYDRTSYPLTAHRPS